MSTTPPPPATVGAKIRTTETVLFTQIPVTEALRHQDEAFQAIAGGTSQTHHLLITEHPPTYLVAADADATSLAAIDEACRRDHVGRLDIDEAKGTTCVGPGQLCVYATVDLAAWGHDVAAFATAMEDIILRTLGDFGLTGVRQADGRSVRVDGRMIATLRTRVRRGVATCRFTIHTNTDPEDFRPLLGERVERELVTMTALGMPITRQDDVRQSVMAHYEAVTGSKVEVPQRDEWHTAKPPWLKTRISCHSDTSFVRGVINEKNLHTVCESAHCPNMGECWSHGTATYMINGNICTRSCSFCAIFTGRPEPIDCDEPRRVAEAAQLMNLKYVVVTSVNRDELPDGGAEQFAKTIRELRARISEVRIEVLIPDFRGVEWAQDLVFEARPDVLNHNLETVPRLYKRVRPQARYQRSLDLLRRAKDRGLLAKSGIMLGLGEEEGEIEQTLRDLHAHGCDIVTIGQYLRPSERHHPLIRYVTPGEFQHWHETGMAMGFTAVEAGPLVRSSYHAHLSFERQQKNETAKES